MTDQKIPTLRDKVEEFARERMKGVTRWDGKTPAFDGHCMVIVKAIDKLCKETYSGFGFDPPWVVDNQKSLEIVAMLHDILEDTDTTLDDILELSGSWQLVATVNALTLRPTMSWSRYIEGIAKDSMAVFVKIFDMAHNSLSLEPGKDKQRRQKYEATALAITALAQQNGLKVCTSLERAARYVARVMQEEVQP